MELSGTSFEWRRVLTLLTEPISLEYCDRRSEIVSRYSLGRESRESGMDSRDTFGTAIYLFGQLSSMVSRGMRVVVGPHVHTIDTPETTRMPVY